MKSNDIVHRVLGSGLIGGPLVPCFLRAPYSSPEANKHKHKHKHDKTRKEKDLTGLDWTGPSRRVSGEGRRGPFGNHSRTVRQDKRRRARTFCEACENDRAARAASDGRTERTAEDRGRDKNTLNLRVLPIGR